ncbi:hypothetical protein M4578_19015 [Salipiger sp. P9]|uniref:N-ATPase subunit AtpR n=1 Tax=Salipiger pentaromativorans TaxID=2943193 RepID=UPI0021574BB0|nr:ATP synthase subunit I [Salipiger pentaromativorans]MCR8549923.1 hypothetical protein [Salipiger pentaromativorans]
MSAALADLPLLPAALGLMAGLALGLVHFATLRRVTALYLSGAAPARALAFQLARFALLIGVLVLLATAGAAPLLGGALGVLLGRAIILRKSREAR